MNIETQACDTASGRGVNPDALHRVLALPVTCDEWLTALVREGKEGTDYAYDTLGRPCFAEPLVSRLVREQTSPRGQALAKFLDHCEQVHRALNGGHHATDNDH